jgi:hypothetical protein
MKSFFDFKETTLFEGGNAFDNTVKITQENSNATYASILKEFLPKLKLKPTDVALLGSSGKKAPKSLSGDIDIALSAKELLRQNKISSFDDIIDHIIDVCKKSRFTFKDMRSIGIVSIAYPITNVDETQPNSFVQVDLMIVQNIRLASWSYFSPSYLESEFKGLYRNILIFSVAKHAKLNVDKIDPNTKIPIEWSRYWFSLQDGLQYGRQTNISAKTGKIVKTQRTLEKKTITSDPDEIVKFLFGPKYKASNLLTFEQAFKAVMSSSFPFKNVRTSILKAFSSSLQSDGLPVPKMVLDAM